MRLFLPAQMPAKLRLTVCPYGQGRIIVSRAGRELAAAAMRPAPLKGMIIQGRQQFSGYIEPRTLAQADLNVALEIPTATVTVDLDDAPAGWQQLEVRSSPPSIFLLLEHQVL
jgi:hypothetical protein